MIRSLLCFLWLWVAVVPCSANADASFNPRAMPVFCPAVLQFMRPSGMDEMPLDPQRSVVDNDVQPEKEPSESFVYELASGRMNTIVAASMLADTDHGWFQWNTQDVAMHEASKTIDNEIETRPQSSLMTVTFPFPVIVRHAWVARAIRLNDPASTSPVGGDFACSPPAYGSRGNVPDAQVAPHQNSDANASVSPSPSPVSGPGAEVARQIYSPFSLDCKAPFRAVTETRVAQPTIAPSAPLNGETYRVAVEVLVGDHDNFMTAAIYQSSNRSDVDAAALSAANASGYSSAISYCRKVPSAAVFWAELGSR